MLSAKLYGIPRAERKPRIADALQFMGLTESGRRLVKTYSGGMIRRLEIAQAMLHRPAGSFPRRADHRPRSRRAPHRLGSPAGSAREIIG